VDGQENASKDLTQTLLESSKLRLMFFLATFLIIVVSSFMPSAFKDHWVISLLPIFPAGLWMLFGGDFMETGIAAGFLGWFIYAIVIMLGVYADHRRSFYCIYFSFILILIANVAGCKGAHL
jgi:hypothetical protein